MRTLPVLTACALAAAVAAPAFAQQHVAGTYDVKYEELATNCSPPPVALGHGKLRIAVKGRSLEVNADLIPIMYGVSQKTGQINAKTRKVQATTVQGLDGKYRVAGRVENGMVTLVLVAEYVRDSDKKPYCTQSWNVSGVRADAGK